MHGCRIVKLTMCIALTGIWLSGCFLRGVEKAKDVRKDVQRIDAPPAIDIPAVSLEQAGVIVRVEAAPAPQEAGGGSP